jgi:predicted TIM-barrel fold metal-dependent hydrolase
MNQAQAAMTTRNGEVELGNAREAQKWVRETRMPVPPPPADSCDCQFHIYADPARYPPRPSPPYPPIDAAFADSQCMHRALGFSRGVIVHSGIYGSDHSLLLDTLNGLDDRSRYRATANIDDSVSDSEMARLDAAGVKAARVNFFKGLDLVPDTRSVLRTLDRLREISWHARLHVNAEDLLQHADLLRSVADLTMVIEHMGHVHFEHGLDHPACRFILEMLKRENWWIMVSNGNRDSAMESGWDDAVPFGSAFLAAAPDRTIWGTDWPHPQWFKRMMNDAEEVELLYRYADYDAALIRKVLVDNPARLYGFE